jgi:hypothetical protein
MKLLRDPNPSKAIVLAVAACVAHRCEEHKDIPPLNMQEGNGSSECGPCAAEAFGARLAEQALELHEQSIVCEILNGYADRLTHHALVMNKLREVRDRLMLAGVSYGDVDDVLMLNQ